MAYRFKPTERFAAGFVRVGLQQIDRVVGEMTSQHSASDVVHQSRKSLKRIRALLRIARPVLGENVFQTENARYRDMGRLLAAARDRHVAVLTVASLEAESGGRAKAAFVALRGWADEIAEQPVGDSGMPAEGAPTVYERVLSSLDGGRAGFVKLVEKDEDYHGALVGLARGYAQARRRYLALDAIDSSRRDSEAVHDWRKSVQYHWRHMALFSEAWPVEFEGRIGVARRIAAVLGRDHDIAVVLAAAFRDDAAHLTARQRTAVQDLALEHQTALRAIAHGHAQKLFAEDREAFGIRMAAYWAAAVEAGAMAKPEHVRSRSRTERAA